MTADPGDGLPIRRGDFSGSAVMAPLVVSLLALAEKSGRRLGTFSARFLEAAADPSALLLCYPATDVKEAGVVLSAIEIAAEEMPALAAALDAAGRPMIVPLDGVTLLGWENLTGAERPMQ